jgi:2-keto-4-pentenoate hydratase/2-oxohepta-3-ene-1,7-dioic acid hydratase in catechol pathway
MRFIRFGHSDGTVHTGVREGAKVRELGALDPFFDWLLGKWFDGSAPLGPEVVTADEIAYPCSLELRLWLNGELMQDSNTRNMIFHIPETITALTAVMTLDPVDVIAMGTPEGWALRAAGASRGRPPAHGD